MAQAKLNTWEDYVGKIFKMKNPGIHGEAARYRIEGVIQMDFGRNDGGSQPAFNVTRLEPEGKFTRACALFKKQFVEFVEEPEDETAKVKDLSPSALDSRLTKVEEKVAVKRE